MNIPQYITSDYQPSINLIEWCVQQGITSLTIEKERPDFILWHQTKKVRRSNFDLAFRNWLKKSVEFSKKKVDTSKKGNQSYREYRPPLILVSNRSIGRDALKQLKELL